MEEVPVLVSKSGIRYAVEENHAFPSVSFGVFVKSGSRYEDENQLGIAHFLEHMVFKETKNRTSFQISHAIESLGGEINAFTSSEYSLFYVKLLSKDIKTGVEILADILMNPTFNPELMERERGVILEEINEYYDDPQDICQTEALRSIWGGHPVARNPLGQENTVSKVNSEDLFSYFQRYFTAENIFVSAVGDIDAGSAEELIDKYFGGFNSGGVIPNIDLPAYRFSEIEFKKDTSQIHLAITFPGSAIFNCESLKNSVFTTMLGGNMSSRLFQRLREERGLVYSVFAYPARLSDTGGTIIYASTAPSKLSEVYDLLMREIEDLRKNGVNRSEFEDARKYLIGSLVLGLESMTSRMQRNGVHGLFTGRIETVHTLMRRLEKIELDEFVSYVRDIVSRGMGKVIVGNV